MRRRLFISLLLLLLAWPVHGQEPLSIGSTPASTSVSNHTAGGVAQVNDTATSDTNSQMPKGIIFHTDEPDSVLQGAVFGFHRGEYEAKIMSVFHPRFDPTGVQLMNPLERHDGNYYLSAGEFGHPHHAVYHEHTNPLGISFAPDLYPTVYKTPWNITFYQTQRPYTLLGYHSSIDKDYQLHVTHTQNVNDRWNVALDYHLFSPEGIYANSSAVDHILDINTNYYSRDSRYQLRAAAIWQRFSLGENGGLSNVESFIRRDISNTSGFPVVSSTASSLRNDLTLAVMQSYNNVRQVPWYRGRMEVQERPSPAAADTTAPTRWDTVEVFDTFYPAEPRMLNKGLVGLDVQFDRHKYRGVWLPSTQYDSLLYRQLTGSVYWTNDAYLDHRWRNPVKVYAGVRGYLADLQLDPARYDTGRVQSTLFYPFAKVHLAPWRQAVLTVLGETGPQSGEHNVDAQLHIALDSTGRNTLLLRATHHAASCEELFVAQQHLIGTTGNRYADESIPLQHAARVEATLTAGDWLDVSVAHTTLKNHLYFRQVTIGEGTTGLLPEWQDATLSPTLLQARVGLKLQCWQWLHCDMQQLVQHCSDDAVRVPLWASKNSVYADFWMFHRALRTQVGVDVRYHTRFYADGYDPSIGAFYRQDDVEVGNYLYADIFVNLQVKRASIYVKAGHINSFLEREAHWLSIPYYAEKPFALFYGLTWQFFD